MSLNRSKFLEPSEDAEIKRIRLDTRGGTIIAFARATGARPQEILNLRPSDLYRDTCTVLIRGLKGSRDRELPITQSLMDALIKYVPFNITYRRLEQIWRDYRPVESTKTFRSLRHTFAVNLYKRTRDIKLTQLALGHKSPSSTAIYTDFVYSQEELRRVLE